MRPAAHHHANATRVDINASTNQLQDNMLEKVNALKEDIIDVITTEKENIHPTEHSMNAATTVSTMSKMTTLL